jgi:nucleotide-binding universal stress UspA family protein
MKILLPIDGSDCSFSTLCWASETFDKSLAQYYLLFVAAPLPAMVGLDAAKAIEYDLDYAQEMLLKFTAELEKRGCNVERAEPVTGNPADEICHYANMVGADQVVMGSHGRTGIDKLILGSVSIKVLERCQCPITIHRETGSRM